MKHFGLSAASLLAIGLGMLLPALGSAAVFQVVVTETPVGSGSAQPIERYLVSDTFGAMTRVSDIPASLTNDPSSVAFRSPLEMFVANRAGHTGNSSISTFTFDPSLLTFTPGPTITGNSVTDAHGLAFNPMDGELFQANWNTGIVSRFKFDAAGNALPNGTITMPDSQRLLGVAIRPADQQLFVSSYQGVRRFRRNTDGSYAYLSTFAVGQGLVHYMKVRQDELYVCDIASSAVYRFRFDAAGVPVLKDSTSSLHVVDIAFSPDGREMFAANHFEGGIRRYRYTPATDSWASFGDVLATPQLGGIATTYSPCHPLAQDFDRDCDVDRDDFLIFEGCSTGPNLPYTPALPSGCTLQRDGNGHIAADFDQDGDVDQSDFGAFQRCYSGAGIQPDPSCAD